MAMTNNSHPSLGATFYPGQNDIDFYNPPELISPLPQRIMPEVPSNMQDELAHLELEAREVISNDRRISSQSTVSSVSHHGEQFSGRAPTIPDMSGGPRGYTANYEHTNAGAYQNAFHDGSHEAQSQNALQQAPTHSPRNPSEFPRLVDAGPNVPPSDREKEDVLEQARSLVLNSNDPEMQLAWAQDALLWVETAVGHRLRETGGIGRSATPTVEHQLRVDAISIVNFLAEQQHPKAVFMKGTWHEFGKFGYPLEKFESIRLYRIAVDKGFARAEYRIGTQYEALGDMHRAIKHYQRGVSMGDSASNYRVGMMTLLGQHGEQQNYQKGIEQIRFAANSADENAPQGAYVYGMLLARELPNITIPDMFMSVDIDQAKQFIEKAAYLGFAKAQQKMGEAYELCLLGCEFNPALSLHYNALAARQGDPEADMAISKWFLCGYEGVFIKNEELAFQYAERAASAGLPTAEFAMGYFFEIGMFVAKDLGHAKEWYLKAAEHGNKDASARLQGISQQKVLQKQDHEQTAINRIRSQYGSKRGARPDRFREKPPPLPVTHEGAFDGQNLVHGSGLGSDYGRSQSAAPPEPRRQSVAPYPEHDVAHVPHGRVQSLRPLPGPVADRPSSAFGIRPANLTPTPQAHHHVQPSRPSTSMGNVSLHQNGRQQAVSGGWQPNVSGRQISPNRGPPSMQYGPGGQPVPYNTPSQGRLQKQPLPDPYQQQPMPPIHHALTEPVYPMTPHDNHHSKPLPLPQHRANGLPSHPGRNRLASQDQHIPRPATSDQRPQSAAQRLPAHVRPQTTSGHSSQSMSGRIPSAATPAIAVKSSSPERKPVQLSDEPNPASRSATAPVPAAPKPVGGGPKTFDEMGIPHTKTEGECIVM